MVAAYAAIHDKTVNIADAYTEAGFDFSGTRSFDERTGYRSQSFLTVPMKNHEGEIIGVLQLINALDPQTRPGHAVFRGRPEPGRIAGLAGGHRAHQPPADHPARGTLFESFINLINLAIDEKSPYTGGHCQRVPALTMMLAEAVERDARRGRWHRFTMDDEDRYELKIAGLLHDCGKVTTPVHVVDKATKLQTLFDRIHLIDTRFEVLKRDAEISALRRQLALRDKRGRRGRGADLGATARRKSAGWTKIASSCARPMSVARSMKDEPICSACATSAAGASGAMSMASKQSSSAPTKSRT